MRKPSFLSKRLGAAAVAVGLCLAVGVGGAFAYYTDSTSAKGTVPVAIGTPTTEVEEGGEGTAEKIITVKSTGDAPAAVRVQLFWGESEADVDVELGEGWVERDGWYYYTQPLWKKDDVTSSIVAEATAKRNSKDELPASFDVAVVQQCAALTWDDEAKGLKADFAGTPYYLYDTMAIGAAETEGE